MVESEEADSRIDGAALTMAQMFGAVALPTGISAAKAAAIESAATFARMLPGAEDFMIGAQGNSPGVKSKSEREEATRDALEFFSQLAEEKQRELEREEWARESHAFAGVTMTGAEWGEFGDELKRDGPLRNWLVTRLMRDGRTKPEAEQKANEMADVYNALSKPPSQRSDGENEAINKAESDPAFQEYTSLLNQQRRGLNAGAKADAEIFASAPPLGEHYQSALTAARPLVVADLRPALRQEAVVPAASSGLDL